MRKYKSWAFLTQESLEELHSQFGTWKRVSEHLEIDKAILIQVRKRLGMKTLDFPDRNRREWRKSRLHDRLEEILRMAQEGKNCGEIAEHLGEPDSEIVRELLVKNNIPRKKVGPPSGPRNPNWKGGEIIDKDGYLMVKAKDHPHRNRNGYVRKHRLVMEEILDRYLRPEEVVHHKDGDKTNNNPENLELFECNGDHIAREWEDPDWKEYQREIRRLRSRAFRNLMASKSDASASP